MGPFAAVKMVNATNPLLVSKQAGCPVAKPAGRQPRHAISRFGNYLTNHVISSAPSFKVRHEWYERYVGLRLGDEARIHINCFIWHNGPEDVRRVGSSIGERT